MVRLVYSVPGWLVAVYVVVTLYAIAAVAFVGLLMGAIALVVLGLHRAPGLTLGIAGFALIGALLARHWQGVGIVLGVALVVLLIGSVFGGMKARSMRESERDARRRQLADEGFVGYEQWKSK